jgi:hypothetical protein
MNEDSGHWKLQGSSGHIVLSRVCFWAVTPFRCHNPEELGLETSNLATDHFSSLLESADIRNVGSCFSKSPKIAKAKVKLSLC